MHHDAWRIDPDSTQLCWETPTPLPADTGTNTQSLVTPPRPHSQKAPTSGCTACTRPLTTEVGTRLTGGQRPAQSQRMANLGPTSQRLTRPLTHMAPRELQQGQPRGSGSSHTKHGGYTHQDAQPATLLPEAWASATSPPHPTQSRNYTASVPSSHQPHHKDSVTATGPWATKPDHVDTGHSYCGRTSSRADAVGHSWP